VNFLLLPSSQRNIKTEQAPQYEFKSAIRQHLDPVRNAAPVDAELGSPYGKPKTNKSDSTKSGSSGPYGNSSKLTSDSSGLSGYNLLGVNWGNVVAKVTSAATTAATTAAAYASNVSDSSDDNAINVSATSKFYEVPSVSGRKGNYSSLPSLCAVNCFIITEKTIAAILQDPDWSAQSIAFDSDASLFNLTGMNTNHQHSFANSVSAVDIRKMYTNRGAQTL
jgi:hypothetical protein